MGITPALLGAVSASGAGASSDWVLLDSATISGSAAQFHFTSAGSNDSWANYRSIMCLASLRNSNGGDLLWRFGSYASGYSWTRADSTASSIYSGNFAGWEVRSDGVMTWATTTSGFFSPFRLLMVDHNDYTLPVGWNGQGSYSISTAGRMNRNMGNWKPSTSVAITELYLISGANNPATQNFEVGSSAQIFGLKDPA